MKGYFINFKMILFVFLQCVLLKEKGSEMWDFFEPALLPNDCEEMIIAIFCERKLLFDMHT
jgi:hypothetical protein